MVTAPTSLEMATINNAWPFINIQLPRPGGGESLPIHPAQPPLFRTFALFGPANIPGPPGGPGTVFSTVQYGVWGMSPALAQVIGPIGTIGSDTAPPDLAAVLRSGAGSAHKAGAVSVSGC